jgi:hypothetical protein
VKECLTPTSFDEILCLVQLVLYLRMLLEVWRVFMMEQIRSRLNSTMAFLVWSAVTLLVKNSSSTLLPNRVLTNQRGMLPSVGKMGRFVAKARPATIAAMDANTGTGRLSLHVVRSLAGPMAWSVVRERPVLQNAAMDTNSGTERLPLRVVRSLAGPMARSVVWEQPVIQNAATRLSLTLELSVEENVGQVGQHAVLALPASIAAMDLFGFGATASVVCI